MKKLYATLAWLSLLLIYGTVGSIELDKLSVTQGLMQCAAYIILWIYCVYRAGAFTSLKLKK